MQVKKQEMLLLEGVAAFGVSLLPAIRFQRRLLLQQQQEQQQQQPAAAGVAAAASDLLEVDDRRAAVFVDSPELLGRALQ